MSGPLYHSPAKIVLELLVQAGEVSVPSGTGWPGFVNTNPAANVQCLSFVDTPGFIRGKTHVDSESQQKYGLQILARSPDPTLPFRKLNELLGILDAISNTIVDVDDYRYNVAAITPSSPVLRIGREQPEDVLTVCSLNLIVSIRQLQGEDS
jgi:hypothetical protein